MSRRVLALVPVILVTVFVGCRALSASSTGSFANAALFLARDDALLVLASQTLRNALLRLFDEEWEVGVAGETLVLVAFNSHVVLTSVGVPDSLAFASGTRDVAWSARIVRCLPVDVSRVFGRRLSIGCRAVSASCLASLTIFSLLKEVVPEHRSSIARIRSRVSAPTAGAVVWLVVKASETGISALQQREDVVLLVLVNADKEPARRGVVQISVRQAVEIL